MRRYPCPLTLRPPLRVHASRVVYFFCVSTYVLWLLSGALPFRGFIITMTGRERGGTMETGELETHMHLESRYVLFLFLFYSTNDWYKLRICTNANITTQDAASSLLPFTMMTTTALPFLRGIFFYYKTATSVPHLGISWEVFFRCSPFSTIFV